MRSPNPTKREGAGTRPAKERFEPKPGLVVAGRYRVERVIGEGGMGIVVAATHVELDQMVAIKFLLPEAMRHPEVVERFLREAKVAAKVKSEHVARVSDVGRVGTRDVEAGEAEADETPFIVMEYLEGRDLGAILSADGRLPLDEACELGLQACEALAEVHAAGIVHRDLKPSNLFVTRRSDGSPCLKLLDFGISKLTARPDDEGVDPALTATATIMGSPSYMSPEQLRSTKEVDARTDVWSLGACLYEAMTGKPAFRGETVPQVCFMIGSEEPAPPSSLRAEIPAELEQALRSALDKKAETRATLVDLARAMVDLAPPRARASLERIEAVMGAEPAARKEASVPVVRLSPAEVARTQASWGDDRKRKRGGGGLLLLFALVVAGVLGVGVYTGRLDFASLRGPAKSAASAVGSVVASATAAVESALPTALPTALPLPLPSLDVSPAPTDSAAADDEDDEAADAASAAAGADGGTSSHPRLLGVPRSHMKPSPKHYVNKTVHRRHH